MPALNTYKYASNASEFCRELETALCTDEKTTLAYDLANSQDSALLAWIRWRKDHAKEVEQFAAATPVQRRKKKAWSDPILFARLTAAALLLLQDGHVLTLVLTQSGSGIGSPNGYRESAVCAGWMMNYLMESLTHDPHWPFPDVDSPFGS